MMSQINQQMHKNKLNNDHYNEINFEKLPGANGFIFKQSLNNESINYFFFEKFVNDEIKSETFLEHLERVKTKFTAIEFRDEKFETLINNYQNQKVTRKKKKNRKRAYPGTTNSKYIFNKTFEYFEQERFIKSRRTYFKKNHIIDLEKQLLLMDLELKFKFLQLLYSKILEIFQISLNKSIHILKQCSQKMKLLENQANARALRTLDIIAMTTTGACKYKELLKSIDPDIIMVEEAAEVLEAQVITCLTENTKQLILIGDHFQLKPKVNCYQLEQRYGFNTSLFERLVEIGVYNVLLETQRRMRPEISQLIRFIYPSLKDDDSVKNMPDIR